MAKGGSDYIMKAGSISDAIFPGVSDVEEACEERSEATIHSYDEIVCLRVPQS